jgi:hypothetical protein
MNVKAVSSPDCGDEDDERVDRRREGAVAGTTDGEQYRLVFEATNGGRQKQPYGRKARHSLFRL